jgi:ABC-type lipopolysaccharide export system ATPase subunit
LKVAVSLFRKVRIADNIVAIVNVRKRDATSVHRELLDFVLPMGVGDDVRFRGATKELVINFSVQRKLFTSV